MITHVVFDLGGVIVELRGKPVKPEWFPADQQPDDVWEKWLCSAAPRDFESGKIDKQLFAQQIIEEMSLTVGDREFLDYFTLLPVAPFRGARELLKAVGESYKTALFSNSNVIHWERKMTEMRLGALFDYHFASHLMGLVKPDAQAFQYVLDKLAVAPEQILFFDDNQMNVDSAVQIGMVAERVVGIKELESALLRHGVIQTC